MRWGGRWGSGGCWARRGGNEPLFREVGVMYKYYHCTCMTGAGGVGAWILESIELAR